MSTVYFILLVTNPCTFDF